jgi:endonuclease YncB( thermonuclease family)
VSILVRIVLFLLVALSGSSACAQTYNGLVVGISDGDSITLLVDRRQHRIRIAGIDAPEHFQPFGNRSRSNLSRYIYKHDVRAECYKHDIYGRDVCRLWVRPHGCLDCKQSLDAGLAQIRDGMAWWDRNHVEEQPGHDRAVYERAEARARQRRLGLWQDKHPVPPWLWRRNHPR